MANRKWPIALMLLVASSNAIAQPTPEPKEGKLVIPITLSPQAAPKPLSNYYLTPQYKEQQPGDQLSGFMKCFMEQRNFYSAEPTKLRDEFNETPLVDLPTDSRQRAGVQGGIAYPEKFVGMMANMDLAARYTRTEWNEYFHVREEGINWLLPEVQYMRHLASVLKVRLRGEIKNGEFDRAIVTIKSLTGLARMFESHPTIIGSLVGIAIQTIAWNGVEEMIAQPGCPNLFWSLVEMPHPPFNISKGYEGERVFLSTSLDYLLTLDRPASAVELTKAADFIAEIEKTEWINPEHAEKVKKPSVRLAAFVANAERVEAARRRLVTTGKKNPDAVSVFSPIQVTLADDVLSYHVLRDEFMKYRNLPHSESMAGLKAMEAQLQAQRSELIVAPILMSASSKVKSAEDRTAQQVASLQILEALRLHAAGNGGQLPATLDAIELPLPTDPATGKPFDYTVKDGVATLTGAKIGAAPQRVYEIRLRK